MLFIFHSFSSVVLLAWLALTCRADSYDFARALEGSNQLQPRALQAAARQSDIAARGSDFSLRNDVLLRYFHDATSQHKDPFAAHVALSSWRPSLVLEEVDHLLDEVHCEENTFQMTVQQNFFDDICNALRSSPEILLVTSHESCNERGDRKPYITTISSLNHVSNVIKLSTKPVRWRDAYSMHVDYGVDYEKYKINTHDHLRRRLIYEGGAASAAAAATSDGAAATSDEAAATSTVSMPGAASTTAVATPVISAPGATSILSSTSSESVSFPSATETAPTSQTSITTGPISTQYIDQPLFPTPGTDIPSGITIDGVGLPAGFTLKCQNCTFTADLALISGSFSTNTSGDTSGEFDGEDKSIISTIEDGFIEFEANNLFTHINFGVDLPISFTESHTITLFAIGLPGISVGSIATIGPFFQIDLDLQSELSADVDMTFGFEVTVPPGSNAIVNFGDISQSNITGFPDTHFTTLPFNVNISDIALTLGATLKPQLLAGITFHEGVVGATAGAGIFFELPALSLNVSKVENIDQNCNQTPNQTIIQELGSEYDALFNVLPDVSLAAGFVAQATATLVGHSAGVDKSTTEMSKDFPLPTNCYGFKKDLGGFESPTLPPASQTAGASGAAAQSSSNAASARGALGQSQAVVDAIFMQALIIGGLMIVGPLLIG